MRCRVCAVEGMDVPRQVRVIRHQAVACRLALLAPLRPHLVRFRVRVRIRVRVRVGVRVRVRVGVGVRVRARVRVRVRVRGGD